MARYYGKEIAGQARNDISQKVILNPDFIGTGSFQDLIFNGFRIRSGMTLEKNRFRVEHGMTMEESHPESRFHWDEGSCNLWEIGFFVAALLRMTVVMNVILSPDFIGMKDLAIYGKLDSSRLRHSE